MVFVSTFRLVHAHRDTEILTTQTKMLSLFSLYFPLSLPFCFPPHVSPQHSCHARNLAWLPMSDSAWNNGIIKRCCRQEVCTTGTPSDRETVIFFKSCERENKVDRRCVHGDKFQLGVHASILQRFFLRCVWLWESSSGVSILSVSDKKYLLVTPCWLTDGAARLQHTNICTQRSTHTCTQAFVVQWDLISIWSVKEVPFPPTGQTGEW